MHTSTPADHGPYRLISIEKSDICIPVKFGGHVVVSRLLKREAARFETIEHAIYGYRWYHIGNVFADPADFVDRFTDRLDRPGIALLDRFGDPTPVSIFRGMVECRIARKRAAQPAYPYRNGPIAGTRRWRRYNRWLRHPLTTAERRANQEDWIEDLDLDIFVPVRGGRRRLPHAWDDMPIGGNLDRSWKRHRRTRWKAVEDQANHAK